MRILHVIILTTWGCKQKMPNNKLGCVQMTHMCYTPYFTASQGCINYTCVSRTIILSAQVTVGRWCDTWRVTEHHSRTFFSGPTPALSLKHPACWYLFFCLMVICQRASVPDIYLRSNTSKIPFHWPSEKLTQKCVSNIFPYHWNTRFGHIGMWLPSATNWHAMAGQMDRGQIWHN